MRPGYCRIRRGLLDHLAAMGPYQATAYLWLHMRARAVGPKAGEVEAATRELATGCGMSQSQAARALRALQPRYLAALGDGRFRIERWDGPGGEPGAGRALASPPDSGPGAPAREASLPDSERVYQTRSESTRLSLSLPDSAHKEREGRRKKEEELPFAAAAVAALAGERISPTLAIAAAATAGQSSHAAAAPPPRHEQHTGRAAAARRAGDGTVTRPADARHGPVRAAILAAYARANGTACPWDGRAARRLAEALAAAPTWSVADWEACVRHRFASDDRPRSEAPAQFAGSLADYRSGPLDRYRRVTEPAAAATATTARAEGTAEERAATERRFADAELRRTWALTPWPAGWHATPRAREAAERAMAAARRMLPPRLWRSLDLVGAAEAAADERLTLRWWGRPAPQARAAVIAAAVAAGWEAADLVATAAAPGGDVTWR